MLVHVQLRDEPGRWATLLPVPVSRVGGSKLDLLPPLVRLENRPYLKSPCAYDFADGPIVITAEYNAIGNFDFDMINIWIRAGEDPIAGAAAAGAAWNARGIQCVGVVVHPAGNGFPAALKQHLLAEVQANTNDSAVSAPPITLLVKDQSIAFDYQTVDGLTVTDRFRIDATDDGTNVECKFTNKRTGEFALARRRAPTEVPATSSASWCRFASPSPTTSSRADSSIR